MEQLYDITEVCATLGTTSRTLRFYEEKGLIKSTVLPPSDRRHYTPEQVETIRQVLALRAFGLPVKTILALRQEHTTLEAAILSQRAELFRRISEKRAQINLLEEMLYRLQKGESAEAAAPPEVLCTETQLETAEKCTNALLRGDYAACMPYFSQDMKTLLPEEALRRSWEIAVSPAGAFLERGPLYRLPEMPNIVVQALHYEEQTLQVQYVFHGEDICGLWTNYATKKD